MAEQPHLPGQGRGDAAHAPRRLLVVDDEQKLCTLLSQYFSLKGYEVRAAASGEDALTQATAFQPHAVLLDFVMPGIDGIEVLRRLKQMDAAMRVIMLSVVDREDVVQRALRLGASAYVCKPANLSQLERLLDEAWASSS